LEQLPFYDFVILAGKCLVGPIFGSFLVGGGF